MAITVEGSCRKLQIKNSASRANMGAINVQVIGFTSRAGGPSQCPLVGGEIRFRSSFGLI